MINWYTIDSMKVIFTLTINSVKILKYSFRNHNRSKQLRWCTSTMKRNSNMYAKFSKTHLRSRSTLRYENISILLHAAASIVVFNYLCLALMWQNSLMGWNSLIVFFHVIEFFNVENSLTLWLPSAGDPAENFL